MCAQALCLPPVRSRLEGCADGILLNDTSGGKQSYATQQQALDWREER